MTRIISLINHKGGVGKTTTTLNLGKALAIEGKRVLVIDIDPQANLSQSVGIDNPPQSIYETLCNDIPLPIRNVSENFDIVPAELGLSTAEIQLQAEQVTGYFKLAGALELVVEDYDYILIDCPPSLGTLTINALLASNEIIIIIEPQYLAIKGLTTILDLHQKLKKSLNKTLSIAGFLFTQVNKTVISKNIMEQVRTKYKDLVFKTIIRQNVKITEASASKKDIFAYDAECSGAIDYLEFAKEIIN